LSFIIRGRAIVLPDRVGPAAVHVRGGRIVNVTAYEAVESSVEVIDVGDFTVSPGIVDTHVHVNEPGRTEWEGFAHATRAAAAGGVTTLVDMPLNSIPATTNVSALEAKRAAAGGQCFVDVGFWGGVVPGNTGDLGPLTRAGALGFKCFLAPSGVAEFEHVSEPDVRAALPVLAELDRPLLVHAELPEALLPIDALANPRAYSTWVDSRPPSSEVAAIELMIDAARQSGARVHIVHLATEEALPALKQARREGVSITVETCPHYLTFADVDVIDGDTRFKCAPPIRSRHNRHALWRALFDGDIDLVVTDHSPAPPSLKRMEDGDFVQAWGGIASLQVGLAAVWTEAVGRGATVVDLARWMSSAPASLAGLQGRKGAIAEGLDADLVVWDPDAEWTVDAAALLHRHPVTPYTGYRLRGRVTRTFVRGQLVFAGDVVGPPRGELL